MEKIKNDVGNDRIGDVPFTTKESNLISTSLLNDRINKDTFDEKKTFANQFLFDKIE